MADPTGAYEKGQLYQLNLSDLQADPNQPRKYLDPTALEDLTASITQLGILTPILFREDSAPTQNSELKTNNSLLIVAGERRFEAAKLAGLTTIPGIFVEGNTAEIALVENLLRQDLTPVEEAEALDRLIKEQNYTQEQLGTIIGKARNTVSEILSLNRLPQEVRDACRADATVGRKALIEIARKKQDRAMITAWNAYKAKQLKAPVTRQKTVETPDMIIEWVNKTTAKLQTINSKLKTENYLNWTDEAKENFQTSLASLKIEITNHQAL